MRERQSHTPTADAIAAEFRNAVYASFRAGSDRMTRIEVAIESSMVAANAATVAATAAAAAADAAAADAAAARAENAAKLQAMRDNTDEIVRMFNAMKGGFKVLEWFGRLAKWAAAIVAGLVALCNLMGWSWPGK